MNRTMNIFLSLFLTLLLFGCGGGGGGGIDTGSAKTLTSLQITTNSVGDKAPTEVNSHIPLGIEAQYQAIGAYSDGSTEDLTTKVTWNSSDPLAASIDKNGLAKALKLGRPTITANYQGVTSNGSILEVTSATVTKIQIIAPASKLAKGLKLQLKALAIFSDNRSRDISSQTRWSSTKTTVLSVDNKGVVTSKSVGVATITASLSGVTGQTTITATNATVSKLQITPASLVLAKGLSKTLTATAIFSDRSTQDVSSQVAWTIGTPGIVTISTAGLVKAVATGKTALSAGLLGVTGNLNITVTNATLNPDGLTIATPPLTLVPGLTAQITAIGSYSDGSQNDVTASMNWVSNDPNVATVSQTGVITAVAPGNTTITGSLGDQNTTAPLAVTVNNAVLITDGLTITPISPLTLVASLTHQLTARGIYDDGSERDITNSVIWTSSDPSIANVDPDTGLVTAVAAGSAIITATLGAEHDDLQVTVNAAHLITKGLTITVPPLTLAVGLTGQLSATGSYDDGRTLDVTTSVIWTSSDSDVATVGLNTGLVTAVAADTNPVIITGSLDGQSVTLQVTVTSAALITNGLTITVPPLTLATGQTGQLSANGSYNDGSTVDVTTNVTWTSSDPAVATVGLHTGLVTAVATVPNTATITGTLSGQTVTLLVTVTDATLNSDGLTITVPPMSLAAGLTGQLSANGSYSDGSTVDVTPSVSWISDDPTVATVSPSGLVTAVAPGTANIIGTLDGKNATLRVTVTNATLNPGGLSITVPSLTLAAGLTGQLSASGSYSNGNSVNVTSSVSWTSSNPAVATVGLHTGLVTAVAAGPAVITATLGAERSTVQVTVNNATLDPNGLTINESSLDLAAGLAGQLHASGSYGSNTVDVTTNVTWTSSDPTIATVGLHTGLVTAVASGSTDITASLGTESATLSVTVTAATLSQGGLTIVQSPLGLAAGLTGQLTANGDYSDGVKDVTANVTWISSHPAVATVGLHTGLVTAVSPGTATITASLGTESATLGVAVSTAVMQSVVIAPISPLAAGTTAQFKATATLSDSTTKDVSADANWQSNTPSVLSITSAGLATGRTIGNAIVSVSLPGGITASRPVAVSNSVVTSLTITSTSNLNVLNLARTITFTAIAGYSDGSIQNVTTSAAWRKNGGLLTLGLGNTFVLVSLLGNTSFQAQLDGVTSNVLVYPSLL